MRLTCVTERFDFNTEGPEFQPGPGPWQKVNLALIISFPFVSSEVPYLCHKLRKPVLSIAAFCPLTPIPNKFAFVILSISKFDDLSMSIVGDMVTLFQPL